MNFNYWFNSEIIFYKKIDKNLDEDEIKDDNDIVKAYNNIEENSEKIIMKKNIKINN